MSGQPICTLIHVMVALLLAVAKDIRDRTAPEYRDFFDRMVADVRQRGVIQPIIAIRRGERYEVVDGETRRLAALVAGAETVPVLSFEQEPDAEALLLAKLQSNAMRLDMNDLEYAAVYQELLRMHPEWSQAALAKYVNADPSVVSKRLQISKNLAAELQARVVAGELGVRSAYQLSRLPDVPTQIDLADKLRAQILCVEGLEHAVAVMLGGRKPKKQNSLKLAFGSVVMTVKGNAIEGLRALHVKLGDVLKKIDREGWGDDFLPGLMK